MGFFAPWFLAGLAAVGVPVFVHLLRRQTTTPRPFSSLMFFERGTQSSTRHRRLRYLLLFALRTALVVLLVLAFAHPFWRRADAGVEGRLLVIVVDNSFSMRARGAAGTKLEEAKAGAQVVLAARSSGQRAQVMLLGDKLQVLTQPIQDAAALRAAVEAIAVSDTHGSFGELGGGLRALGETIHTPIDLHLFSDMQRGNMPGNFADMVLLGNVTLVLHRAGPSASAANWTVESVDAPADLADTKDVRHSRVKAVIAGYNTPAAERAVLLVVGERTLATKRVMVPANGRATVEFAPLDLPYGLSRCAVRLEGGDALSADDAAVFSVRRSDPERVLFVHGAGDARSPLYFGAALQAAGQASFVLQAVAAGQTAEIDPAKYGFVVLSDVAALPANFEGALGRYVRGGGGLLIALGTGASRRGEIPVWGGSVGAGRFYAREGGFARAGEIDSTSPVTPGALADVRFFYAAGLGRPDGRVVARLTDGTPLLLDRQIGEGRVLLFASGLDNLTNDLPLHPAFVPLVDRVARYLSGSQGLSGARTVGAFVQLRSAEEKKGAAGVEVIDPEGKRPLTLAEAATAQSFPLTRAGFYQVRYANGRDAVIGVNPDRRESDLSAIPDDVLRLWSGAGGGPETTREPVRPPAKQPYGVWWFVMLLALVAAVAESIVANFHLGTQREEA